MLSLLAGAVITTVLAAPAMIILSAWVSIDFTTEPYQPDLPAQEQGAVRIAEPTTTPFSAPGSS